MGDPYEKWVLFEVQKHSFIFCKYPYQLENAIKLNVIVFPSIT